MVKFQLEAVAPRALAGHQAGISFGPDADSRKGYAVYGQVDGDIFLCLGVLELSIIHIYEKVFRFTG